jgi:rhodanese-related sulfurtransferase
MYWIDNTARPRLGGPKEKKSMQKITTEELEKKMTNERDELLLLDTRGDEAYAKEHLPHAKSIPESALRERVEGVVDKDTEIIVYCTDEDCPVSRKAGEQLESMGYINVVHFSSGIEGWKESGHQTVSG